MRHRQGALAFAMGVLLALPSLVGAEVWGFGYSYGSGDHRDRRDDGQEWSGPRRGFEPAPRNDRDEHRDDERGGFGFSFGLTEEPQPPVFFFPRGGPRMAPEPDPSHAPEEWPPTGHNVDDAKKVKLAVKMALLVGVGHDKGDEAISDASVGAVAAALQGGWGFAKVDIKQLVNAAGTKGNILSDLDRLIANANAAKPAGIEAYIVVVYIQGHSTKLGDPAMMKDGVKGTTQPKDEKVARAYWASDGATSDANTGLLYTFELYEKLNDLSQALAKLEKAGVTTGLIVQMDACWSERYFDGWRGADGKGNLPSNVYAAWAADRAHVSFASGVKGVEAPTPWANGFAQALDIAGGAQAAPSVQSAHQDAGDATNRARKRQVEKNPGMFGQGGKKPDTTQGAGHAESKGAAPLRPSDFPTNKPM